MQENPYQRPQTPADLVASSKKKFALALARLRREQRELALLSLHGSLSDAFRAYLLPRGVVIAEEDWSTLLETMAQDSHRPLSDSEEERIRRTHRLRLRIAQGETITLTQESTHEYQEFVAALLQRYGVTVVVPDDLSPGTASSLSEEAQPQGGVAGWVQTLSHHYGIQLAPILATLLLCIFLSAVGAIITQQARQMPGASPQPSPTLPSLVATGTIPEVSPGPPSTPPPGVLARGRTAYVRRDVVDGLALRIRPSNDVDVPVQIYLDAGTAVEVIGGPVYTDGYTWWQVRAANQQGWCAGEFLEVR